MSARARAPAASACGILAIALMVVTAAPRPASAQSPGDVEAARALFIEGTRLGNDGRWEARELYARSLQLRPAPLTHYSLGVARRETGQFAGALSSFRAFLAEPPSPATAPYVAPARAAIATLEGTIGRLTITVEPRSVEGLTLAIDGQPVPATSTQAREVDPGPHEVVARAPGFLAATSRIDVAEGSSAAVTIMLIAGTNSEPGPSSGRTLPIVLMGLGGALFGTGLTVGLVGVRQADSAPTRDGADARSARAKALAGDVIGGAGLATAGVGLILLLTQGRSKPGPARPALVPSMNGIALRF